MGQSVEDKLRSAEWSDFSKFLLDRFGRKQKELLIRQLFHIRQSGSVADYVSQFSELLDQLVAYGHVTEPIYYAMRFLDGLRSDIKSAVSLHRPTTFDTAASLALLQEDVTSAPKGLDSRRVGSVGILIHLSRRRPKDLIPFLHHLYHLSSKPNQYF